MTPADTQTNPVVEQRIAEVATRLSESLGQLLAQLPGAPRRPRDIQRLLGVNKDIASRVSRASDEKDPLAIALVMPGPAPLRDLLAAAKRKGVSASSLASAEKAINEFDSLIRDDIGDRMTLDGIVGALLPQAREKQEIFCKQSVFRGMAQLKGSSAETMINTAIMWPGEQSDRLDGVCLAGWFGLRRVRPGATVHYYSGRMGSSRESPVRLALGGEPIADPKDIILHEFSSAPEERIVMRQRGEALHYLLGGSDVGRSTAVDIVLAEFTPSCLPMRSVRPGMTHCGPTMEIIPPCKLAVLDVFVHRDAFPDTEPELRVYDTVVHGVAEMNDEFRKIDQFSILETVTEINSGTSSMRIVEAPRYPEMVQTVFKLHGLNPSEFRLFRCRSRYPVYGSQFSFCFRAAPGNDGHPSADGRRG